MSSSVYPNGFDDDSTIQRVDDNITEIGGLSIDQLRDAVFAIEQALGLNPGGSVTSVTNRLGVSLNPDGTIKASALASIGLVTLPITGNQVASHSIPENKLSLDFATADLHTQILANQALLNSLTTFSNAIATDLGLHISGATKLSNGSTFARHVASQIDINSVPNDSRDTSFIWTGLKDKNGITRTATQVAQALSQINNDLVNHENAISAAHAASAITVNTDHFTEVPVTTTDVQKLANYVDQSEFLNLGQHRATQHANAIPRTARSSFLLPDGNGNLGFGQPVVLLTPVQTYLTHAPNVSPVDDLSIGDDVVRFVPNNTNFNFDAQFSQVKVGDIITINYGNNIAASFPIESIRFVPGSEWVVRINGVNLADSATAVALIDRASADSNTAGIFAVAPADARDANGPTYTSLLSSLVVGHPRGATALGLGFNPGQLNSTHYLLYLEIYPTGNPLDKVFKLPGIDVTGNKGTTPGNYTLSNVVQNINDQFRQLGFNYRFIAFAHQGEVGIMLSDVINNASFAIIVGDNSTGTLNQTNYQNNIIGIGTDDFDALGFYIKGANLASPAFQHSWVNSTAALSPTKIIPPLKNKFAIINGRKIDDFAPTYLAIGDGYWNANLTARNPVGSSTVEVTYTVNQNLNGAGLKIGKTILVQPVLSFTDGNYFDVDYGRFIIKNVVFTPACGTSVATTQITVINGIYGQGNPFTFSSSPTLPVKLYFGYDSVGFDQQNLIDSGVSSTSYSRFHEIFVNDSKQTFAHERARMPRQSETPTLLNTNNWHILNVSPKLRGYTDGIAGVFNRYIRFYINSYNSTTGEYDGYLAQRIPSSSNIVHWGTPVTGRKNVATRFYDETNIDYIDVLFREDGISPGTNILSTASARYVDIELFQSLQTDEELFPIAICETNWTPITGQDIVQYVNDIRQFGSVKETNFTDSAIDFINAGNKYLHENGVIRGFDLDTISSVANSGEIFFKGGLALVNGKIVTSNNGSVVIPQVYPAGTALPQTLNWAICVDVNGFLVPIILTSTKTQFFATPGTSSYYLQSVTLQELAEKRKDLTPIALANVTIASLTVNSVTDFRKFVASETQAISLSWSSDKNVTGNFQTFTALQNWINNYGGFVNEVKARGSFNITSSIDLSQFTKKVIFDGINAIFNINCNQGFLLGNNIVIKNCTFNYTPSGITYAPNALVNSGNGCLFAPSGANVSDVVIKNCTFNSTSLAQRPPFISFELQKGQVNKNIDIFRNTFNDISPGNLLAESQAVISFIATNTGISTNSPVLLNCRVESNTCNFKQGIYIMPIVSSVVFGLLIDPLGINTINVNINKNNCGIIGYLVSNTINSLTDITNINQTDGLVIKENTCHVISNFFNDGYSLSVGGAFEYSFGKTVITNNFAHWINVQHLTIDGYSSSSIEIINNHLTAFDTTYLALFSSLIGGTFNNWAINVIGSGVVNSDECLISGNNISFGRYNGVTRSYDRGINSDSSATVTNNIIRGLNTNASGMAFLNTIGGFNKNYLVRGNKIYRGSVTLTNYIQLPTTGTSTSGIITDNFFDSPFIDIAATNTQVVPSSFTGSWIIEKNINQRVTAILPANVGRLAIGPDSSTAMAAGGSPGSGAFTSSGSTCLVTSGTFKAFYGNTNTTVFFHWDIPLFSVLPPNVTLISVSTTVQANIIPDTTKTCSLYFFDGTTTSPVSSITFSDTNPHVLTNTSTGFNSKPGSSGGIFLVFDIKDTTVACQLTASPMTVVYQW